MKIKYIPTVIALFFGIIAVAITAYTTALSVQNSTSSTAAIGYLFIPVIGVIAFVLFGTYGYFLGKIITPLFARNEKFNYLTAIYITLLIVVTAIAIKFYTSGRIAEKEVSYILYIEQPVLTQVLGNLKAPSIFNFNVYKFAAIAQNPHAQERNLAALAHMNSKSFNHALGSAFSLNGNNKRGISVYRLIVKHPNVNLDIISYLATKKDPYLLGDIAGNISTPVSLLETLYTYNNYLIEWGLAQNENTPAAVLKNLAHSQDEHTRYRVTYNPSTPKETLEKLSRDSKSHIRRGAKRQLENKP